MFLALLGWISIVFLVVFCTLCLACGLYYLAEMVEEYTALTKKCISYLIYSIIVIHFLVWFDGIPFFPTVPLGILANLLYLRLLKNYPYFSLTSVEFLGSCVMVFVHHFCAFSVFTNKYFPFLQVVAFFILCVWLVPFIFFISLSANENTLPTIGSSAALNSMDGSGSSNSSSSSGTAPDSLGHIPARRGRRNGLLAVFAWMQQKRDELLPSRSKRLL